ncbi:MAG: type 4a pilus biogenesis protein PilO [Candidatus Omnitrophica bacterium]|jgi:Tfp pilus assembly protein PilO|nr:type 4a pilus biogenesis protein PilO [Candidatus Omnitrophota bacterium]
MQSINEILNNPKVQKIIIIIVAAILVAAYYPFALSLWNKNKAIDEKISLSLQQINLGSHINVNQQATEEEFKKSQKQILQLADKFFISAEEIFVVLNKIAAATKISFKNIEPFERQKMEIPNRDDMYIDNLPVKVDIVCNYHQLITLLDKIEKTDKFISVEDIRIRGVPSNIWEHEVQINLKVPLLVANAK